MKKPARNKSKKRGKPARRADPLIGVRLKPAMREALDEMALEWQVTRAYLMRELIAHALKAPPRPPAKK